MTCDITITLFLVEFNKNIALYGFYRLIEVVPYRLVNPIGLKLGLLFENITCHTSNHTKYLLKTRYIFQNYPNVAGFLIFETLPYV